MDPLLTNPFAVLTFVAAPAILTNASSVMALGTTNRFARAIDRARGLSTQLEKLQKDNDPLAKRRARQLEYAERRALLLVRALTAFYTSVGGFAGASFTSLLGAVFVITQHDQFRFVAMMAAFLCGLVGVSGLLSGSAILVWETRMTLAIVSEEVELLREGQLRRETGDNVPPP
ncbi:MAG: DUF2721 domain-containing protein [Planctomycetia bacterium]|nr:DUF2721 domain-containing protein [Planctomycetia bacterium]